jgi:protein gp37
MSNTKIEWTEKVWNPVTGCTQISPGCQNCFAKRMANRLRGRAGYPWDDPFKVTFHPDRLDEPLHWKKPCHIFVCSMSDLFHDDVTDDQLDMVFSRIVRARHTHVLQILTKRPERLAQFMRRHEPGPEMDDTYGFFDGRTHPATGKKLKTFGFRKEGWPLTNIWFGVTAENQEWLINRFGYLAQIPASVRFLSLEPLLGPMDVYHHLPGWEQCSACGRVQRRLSARGFPLVDFVDWVIVGPETINGKPGRSCELSWIHHIVEQCHQADTPVFVKAIRLGDEIVKDINIIAKHLGYPPETLRQYPWIVVRK